jgi:hypothetical protein
MLWTGSKFAGSQHDTHCGDMSCLVLMQLVIAQHSRMLKPLRHGGALMPLPLAFTTDSQ